MTGLKTRYEKMKEGEPPSLVHFLNIVRKDMAGTQQRNDYQTEMELTTSTNVLDPSEADNKNDARWFDDE